MTRLVNTLTSGAAMTVQAHWDTPAACTDPTAAPWFDAAHALERLPRTLKEREVIVRCQSVCAACPSRRPCAALQRAGDERLGVWSGEHIPSRLNDSCGTPDGYRRHQRSKNVACAACRDAWSAYQRDRKAERVAS